MMQRSRSVSSRRRDPLLPAYFAIAATGLYVTSFGPALGTTAADLGVSKATASLLLTALFVGSISASATIAWRLHGHDQRRLGSIGSVALAFGALAMGVSPWWPLALAGALVIGFGDGLLVTAAHILVAASSSNLPRDMSRLNLSFAFGAIAGPLWTGFALETWDSLLAIYLALATFTLPLAWLLSRPHEALHPRGQLRRGPAAPVRGFDLPVFLLAGALVLYVGSEAGLGAWVASYAEESFGSGLMTAAAITSGYWTALALGRLACSSLLGRGTNPWFVLAGAIAVAVAATVALTFAGGSIALAVVAAFVAGLRFGPVWPATLGIASDGRHPRVPATLITIASLGGVVLPFAQGLVLKAAGPRIGFTAALCVLMLALVLSARTKFVAVDAGIAAAPVGIEP
jgi:fucose permease